MSQDADADATEFSGSSVVQGKGGMFPQQKSEKSLENDDQSADFGVPHLWKKNRFASSRRVVDVPDLEQGRFLRLAFSTTLFKISSQKQGFNQEK